MRHRRHFRRLNRTMEHRLALRRNMAKNFFEHEELTTTFPKAKNLRPFVERLITLAVRVRRLQSGRDSAGALRARRRIEQLLVDRSLVPKEHRDSYNQMSDALRGKSLRMASGRRYRTGEPRGRLAFTGDSVVHRLIDQVAAKHMDREGGYTRLIRLPSVRLGDGSALATLRLVGGEMAPMSVTKPGKSARRRRADRRYGLAIKLAKSAGGRTREPAETAPTAAAD